MHLLAISTSTPRWSVFLHRDDGWSQSVTADTGRGLGQSNTDPRASLTRMVWDLFAEANLQPADLQRVVCDVGPGSFTGLRQGLALARALAWAHGIPTHAVGSLHAMALESCGESGQKLVAAIPARAHVDFVGVGTADDWKEQLLSADDAAAWWQQERPEVLAMAGADQGGALAQLANAQGARILARWPRAEVMGQWSLRQTGNVASELVPRYLAVSEAENKAGIAVPERTLVADDRMFLRDA